MKLGIDIGGTKCAVVLGDGHRIFRKIGFQTTSFEETFGKILDAAEKIGDFDGIGISCGGPLDSKRGLILSPPNLPGWDNVPIVSTLRARFGVPTYLCNDANASALAEWKYGAGIGTRNMIFLTFGTGMGAGLIVDGALYEGACGMAGEIGHIRMEPSGPVGYGKAGSFEGFCSGGGLAKLGRSYAEKALSEGKAPAFCPSADDLSAISAKKLSDFARNGDADALEIFRICGEKLGAGLSILLDLLNPERIVIGSIFARAEALLRPSMEAVLRKETLAPSLAACKIVPAALGDELGDYAALAVAHEFHLKKET